MKEYYWLIFAVLIAVILAGCQGEVKEGEQAGEADAAAIDTAAIQDAMGHFIEQKLEVFDGLYPIDEVEAEFAGLHAEVNEGDGLYASCADFKAGEDVYDVDFYVKVENGKYTVVREVLHKMNGEVVNEVLWEQQ